METLFEDLDQIEGSLQDEEAKKKLNGVRKKIALLRTKSGLKQMIKGKKIAKAVRTVTYESELKSLQVELIRLQNWVHENNLRVVILFEGRDAAGKGGAIKRFTESLNPRKYRVVALPKPTEVEMGQFYFQRYMAQLPNPGEIVFFDRSWYNRAVVEPVFNFCTEEQYERFMHEVPEIEHALVNDGIILIKFWFSISKETQRARFKERENNPLKQWKLSPVDLEAQKRWDDFTRYKEQMFSRTHTGYAPWIIVNSNDKLSARLEAIRYVLSTIPYEPKGKNSKVLLSPDPAVVKRYHRMDVQEDV